MNVDVDDNSFIEKIKMKWDDPGSNGTTPNQSTDTMLFVEEDLTEQRATIPRVVAVKTNEADGTDENKKLDENKGNEKKQIAKRYDNWYNEEDMDLLM